jgi:hypothetical protein
MEMPGWLDLLGRLMDRVGGLGRRLGNLESSIHRDALDEIAVDRPIHVAGLARSGSTILLEMMASHADTATHRYRDFPPVMTPIFWNKAFGHIYKKNVKPVERAHKDRILVTPDSPEAFEEVLWMAFFEHAHNPDVSSVLDRGSSHPAFEDFYRDHIRKILYIREGRRYLTKCNYSLTRLAYLSKLFPDARFVVPVREPLWHVASLTKQHRLFCEEETTDPRILAHMRRVGHFEFGLDRRAVNIGSDTASSIERLWADGQEIRGTARLWSSLYGFVLRQLEEDEILRQQTIILRYEDLCDRPQETLRRLVKHVELPFDDDAIATLATRLSRPAYYRPELQADEEHALREETTEVAHGLGYNE